MGICWSCYWGWSKPVVEIYEKYRKIAGWDAMHYGPAHIVWEDENFETHHIQWCLDNFDEFSEELTDRQKDAVRQSLEEMLEIPEHIRNPEPEDYDSKHPELYPPPRDLEMVK